MHWLFQWLRELQLILLEYPDQSDQYLNHHDYFYWIIDVNEIEMVMEYHHRHHHHLLLHRLFRPRMSNVCQSSMKVRQGMELLRYLLLRRRLAFYDVDVDNVLDQQK